MNEINSKIVAMVALAAPIVTPGQAYAMDNPCPSTDDVAYSTQVGDTWWTLGSRAYCLDGPNARFRAALSLYEYNRGRAGPNVDDLPDGTTVCLPKFLHRASFDAERCHTAPKPPKEEEVCGNKRREGDEICDGSDLGGATCADLNLPNGLLTCRVDCRGFNAKACIESVEPKQVEPPPEPPPAPPPPPPPRTDEPAKPTHVSLAGDFAAGALFPLSDKQRTSIHGVLALARGGARFGIGPIELSLQGVIGGGMGTTLFNNVESHVETFIAGGGIQAGVPLLTSSLRFTPGIEALRLWMSRSVDMPPGYRPAHYAPDGGISYVGAFLRSEYRFSRYPRVAATIEVAVDFVPTQIADLDRSENFQLKTLAGVSYAAF